MKYQEYIDHNKRVPVTKFNTRPLDPESEDETEFHSKSNSRSLNNNTINNIKEIKMSTKENLRKKPLTHKEFDIMTGNYDQGTLEWFERKVKDGEFSILKMIQRKLGKESVLTPVESLFQQFVKENYNIKDNQRHFYREIGFKVPNTMLSKRTTLTTSNSSKLVASTIRPDLIEPLHTPRLNDYFTKAQTDGPNLKTGESSTLPVPVWVAEGDVPSPTEPDFTSLDSTPKIITTDITKSRNFFLSQSEETGKVLENDILDSINVAIGAAGLYGAGGAEPTGLNSNADLQTTSGVTFSHTTAVTMENLSENANAKANRIYVMHPDTKKILKLRETTANTGKYIITPDNLLNGYPVLSTTSCLSTDVWFGDFSSILEPIYGLAFEVEVLKLDTSGAITVQFWVYRDIIVRNGASFVKAENFS